MCPGTYNLDRLDKLADAISAKVSSIKPATSTKPSIPVKKPAIPSKPTVKSVKQLADETIAGKYGNGDERKRRLGTYYNAVQAEINRRLGAIQRPNISALADAVMRGEYGNGDERKRRLGVSYAAVQAEINRRFGV
jgi:hypothetical protein